MKMMEQTVKEVSASLDKIEVNSQKVQWIQHLLLVKGEEAINEAIKHLVTVTSNSYGCNGFY